MTRGAFRWRIPQRGSTPTAATRASTSKLIFPWLHMIAHLATKHFLNVWLRPAGHVVTIHRNTAISDSAAARAWSARDRPASAAC